MPTELSSVIRVGHLALLYVSEDVVVYVTSNLSL